MISLDDIVQVSRCPMLDIFWQQPSFCRRWIALGYGASVSVVMDDGGQSLVVFTALRRNQ
jgi:hypothetical protein